MLQLLEQRRFDHYKPQARSATSIGPCQAAFCADHGFTIRQQETDVDQSSKPGGIAHYIESHASRAEVECLDLQFLAVRISQRDSQIDFSAKELLLVLANDAKPG